MGTTILEWDVIRTVQEEFFQWLEQTGGQEAVELYQTLHMAMRLCEAEAVTGTKKFTRAGYRGLWHYKRSLLRVERQFILRNCDKTGMLANEQVTERA